MRDSKGTDWERARTMYITSSDSLTKIAAKIGVRDREVYEHSRLEGWVTARAAWRSETAARAQEAAAQELEAAAAKVARIAIKGLDKLDELEAADAKDAKALSSALRDLYAVLGLKSKLDEEEQQARIAKLRHDAEAKRDDQQPPTLEIVGMPEEFKA